MSLSAKTIRAQMVLLKPLLASCSLETIRKGQNMLGELMEARYRQQVRVRDHGFATFTGAWIMPCDERRQGVILYLHGGGYTCGNLDYAKGFGSMLAEECGMRVFCAGYRLAPEHPFPAALEDALEAYEYLLKKGYAPDKIVLCGESAGGGLCYSLCLRLQEQSLPLPRGIIGISPWTDLTASGASYEENKEIDPSLSAEQLDFYASCYATDRSTPLVSPLFADLTGFPPSLLFAGKDEILRSDAEQMHQNLLHFGCKSTLYIRPGRWHAYILYGLEEDREDLQRMNRFLDQILGPGNKLRWMRLDNAAKIYPAARRQNWSSVFRLSVTLTEPVDVTVLQSALDVTARRFPSIATRLRKGLFWYYLQELGHAPTIRPESSYPLTRMSSAEIRKCALRVIVYKRRIAVEFFHSLTDGTGGLIFLKTLLAEYLQQKYALEIPAQCGVLGRLEDPSPLELEDSFQKYSGKIIASRAESDAWRLTGTPEPGGFLHVTCFRLSVAQILEEAHRHGVSLTIYLAAVMTQAILNLQAEKVPIVRRRKPVKVQIPVNLRNMFPSSTMRNFALYTSPEVDPRLGTYTFDEICQLISHWIGLNVTEKQMRTKIAANVETEKLLAVKILPLFLKNIIMKTVFDLVGEKKSCLSLSNLGAVQLPEVMCPYVQQFDFILPNQASAPHNCGVISFGDTLCINIARNIREPELEKHFFQILHEHGLSVEVQSNQP